MKIGGEFGCGAEALFCTEFVEECIALLSPNEGRIGKRMRNFRMVN